MYMETSDKMGCGEGGLTKADREGGGLGQRRVSVTQWER